MDTKELLNKIAKLKNAIELESDADTKKLYQKKVDALEKQIAEAEVKVEKVEAKAAAEEKKDLSEAEEKIKKLKSALALESDADTKALYQKKISKLEESLKEVKEEIKEEKKEIAEQKKDIKQATKEVKSAQREVRKTAIKKVAAKQVERKQVVTRKAKRKTKIKSIISDLDALINKNKQLKAKYKGKGTGKPVSLERDAARSAKPFGYRFVGKHDYRVPTEAQVRKGLKRGTIDYEGRPNRSDVYPKAKAKLADGGMIHKMADNMTDAEYEKKFSSLNEKQKKKYNILVRLGDSPKLALATVLLNKEVKWDDDTERAYTMADGGMMARGGKTKMPEWTVTITSEDGDSYDWVGFAKNEDEALYEAEKEAGFESVESGVNMITDENGEKIEYADGGMMARGGNTHMADGYNRSTNLANISRHLKDRTSVEVGFEKISLIKKRKEKTGYPVYVMAEGYPPITVDVYENREMALKKAKELANKEGYRFADWKLVGEFQLEEGKMAKGGTIKKKVASKSNPKPSKKVGKSVQDKHRFAKPAGWRWKEEAFQKRIIERKQLAMSPSKKMRDKYPDLVYYEDRLNKADQKPTRTSADSI